MTYKDLRTELKTLKVNYVGYTTVPKNTKLPYIAVYSDGTENDYADDGVFMEHTGYVLELYTKFKDFELENSIKTLLSKNEIGYSITTETYLDVEKTFMVVFEFELQEVL